MADFQNVAIKSLWAVGYKLCRYDCFLTALKIHIDDVLK